MVVVIPSAASLHLVTKAILPVSDMAESLAFYRRLGFEVETDGAEYAWVRHDGEEVLHLRYSSSLEESSNESAVYFHVADAGVWHSTLRQQGVAVGDVEDRPWGMREFSLVDPSGNLIRVGHNL